MQRVNVDLGSFSPLILIVLWSAVGHVATAEEPQLVELSVSSPCTIR